MNREARAKAEARWRWHLKPHRALGALEDVTFRLADLRGKLTPAITRSRLLLFIADHGVALRGVSAMDPSATAHLIDRISAGGTAANIFCQHAGVELVTVDVGSRYQGSLPHGIVDHRIKSGTNDISTAPAMSDEQRDAAIRVGRQAAQEAIADGIELIGVGEIGIGNTTIAAALAAALLNLSPEATVDRGTGINDQVLELKKTVVSEALQLHRNQLHNPMAALGALGGFEFAALVGVILACGESETPVVIDGFATSVSALIAHRISPVASKVTFVSHMSRERGQRLVLRELGQDAIFDLDFALGEGTGAILGVQFLCLGSRLLAEMDCF